MMRAVWFRVLVEMRARWRANVAVMLLVGIGATLALGAFAGARRTASAYPRFLEAQGAADVGTADGPFTRVLGLGGVPLEQVRTLPQVERVEVLHYLIAGLFSADGDILIEPGRLATFPVRDDMTMERVRVLEGRLPEPASFDEIAVGFEAARDAGIVVGDRVVHVVIHPDSLSDPSAFGRGDPVVAAPMEVVGLAAFPGAFPPNPRFGQYIVSPAFVDRYRAEAVFIDALMIDIKPGVSEAEIKAELDRLGGGRQFFFSQAQEAADVQRSIDLEAGALRIFALIVAFAAWLIVGQALTRLLLQDRNEHATMRALGMTPAQRRALLFGRVLLVAFGGTGLAVLGAWLLSLVMPLGLAGIAEPSPGLSFDAFALGIGALVAIALVFASTVPSVIGMSLRRLRARPLHRRSRFASGLASAGFSPTATAGVRMAVEQGHGVTATPVRTVVVGVAVAVAALVAAVNVGGSIDRLLATPSLYGWDYDGVFGNPYAPGVGEAIAPVLDARDDVAAIAAGTTLATVQIEGPHRREPVAVQAFDLVRGSVHPPVAEGRWPADLDEVALGSRIMQRLAVEIGDRVTVDAGSGPRPMEVVGRAVFPSFGDPNVGELGEAAGMTFEAYQRLAPSVQPTVFLVRLAVGADREKTFAAIERQLGMDAETAERPGDLDGIARVDGLPIILAATLGLLAVATLVHALVTTIRRRRRDLAILQTLGFVGHQLRSVVVWQAVTLTLMALAVGVPLGIAGGRWLWRLIADRVGFVADPVAGLDSAAIIAGITVAAAVIISQVPAIRAARLRPAAILRSE